MATDEAECAEPGGDAPVERTPDGRHIIVNGRRWRASDPSIPEALRTQLVAELMAARRLARTDAASSRPRVQDAKVALGERGEPWWDEPTEQGRRERLAATMRALLRGREGTICPSEVARVVGGDNWRDLMETAREVAFACASEGVVEIQQGGTPITESAPRGPIRIARGQNWDA